MKRTLARLAALLLPATVCLGVAAGPAVATFEIVSGPDQQPVDWQRFFAGLAADVR